MKVNVIDRIDDFFEQESFNPPDATLLSKDPDSFNQEMELARLDLEKRLSVFGSQGTWYGIDHFALFPDWSTGYPPNREFAVTVLSEVFYQTAFLAEIVGFLRSSPVEYQVVINQDFTTDWHLRLRIRRSEADVNVRRSKKELEAICRRLLPL